LSLDQLSAAFAEMLSTGADPYSPAPPPEDEEPLLAGLEAEAATGSQAGQPDACEITPRSILEALLFVGIPSGEPLTSEQIARLMRGVRPAEIDAFVCELNDLYDGRRAPYYIAAEGAGYRMRLREEFSRVRDKFYGRSRRAKLSQAAIEVLSLVAYHEPLTAEEVTRLRGTASGPILSQLVRRQLLKLERTPAHARGEYSTTDRFLKLFGLESLADLPRSQDLEAS
jgi:segregation and condensation protein B